MGTPKGYFTDKWNYMDFTLACLSVISCWILPSVSISGDGSAQVRLTSVLRILRMLRLLRLLRFLKFFHDLLLLVQGFLKATTVLSWVVVLFGMVAYVAALFMTHMVGHECETSFQEFGNCEEMFGTMLSSMYTLFQVVTLESWSMEVSRPVLREKPYLVLFFLCFLYTTTFGLLNIVTGVIVDHTLQQNQEDEEEWNLYRLRRQKKQTLNLHKLFCNIDTNTNGNVGLQEFLDTCKTQQAIYHFLDGCNLQVSPPENAERLFKVLDYEEATEMSLDDLISRTLELLDESALSSRNQCGQLIELRRLTRSLNGDDEDKSILLAIGRMEKRVIHKVTQLEHNLHQKMQEIEDSEGFLKLVNFHRERDVMKRKQLRDAGCDSVTPSFQCSSEASLMGNCVWDSWCSTNVQRICLW